MFYAYLISAGKYYYFTGKEFNDDIEKRKTYKTASGLKTAVKNTSIPFHILSKVFLAKTRYTHKPVKRVKRGRSKNPTNRTNQNIGQAIKRYEAFTESKAQYVDKVTIPTLKEGFKFGRCDGILYTTVINGKTEKFIHEFKDSSRPILASNHDGAFIALVGGNYHFTDRGIVDK